MLTCSCSSYKTPLIPSSLPHASTRERASHLLPSLHQMGTPPPLFSPRLQLQLSLLSLHKNGFSPSSNPDLPLPVSSRHWYPSHAVVRWFSFYVFLSWTRSPVPPPCCDDVQPFNSTRWQYRCALLSPWTRSSSTSFIGVTTVPVQRVLRSSLHLPSYILLFVLLSYISLFSRVVVISSEEKVVVFRWSLSPTLMIAAITFISLICCQLLVRTSHYLPHLVFIFLAAYLVPYMIYGWSMVMFLRDKCCYPHGQLCCFWKNKCLSLFHSSNHQTLWSNCS